jgi:hypothetical protein
MARLSNASKQAAQAVANKIAGKVTDTIRSTTTTQLSANQTNSNLPGLMTVTPDLIPAMMPAFKPEDYRINDPLNPPDTLPQASASQFDKGMKIYEGATRAIKLVGASFDLTREKFVTIGKHSKAFGAGIQTASEVEKVKGNFLDYLNQKEITSQKNIALDVNQNTTITNSNVAEYSKQDLGEKLKQAEIKSEELRLKTVESQGKLTSFRESLGEYLEGSK